MIRGEISHLVLQEKDESQFIFIFNACVSTSMLSLKNPKHINHYCVFLYGNSLIVEAEFGCDNLPAVIYCMCDLQRG